MVGRGVRVILVLVGCEVGVFAMLNVLVGKGDVGVLTTPSVLVGRGAMVGNVIT